MLVVQMGLECHHTWWNVHYAPLSTHHTRFSARIIRIQLIAVNSGGKNMVPKSVIVRPFPRPLSQRQRRRLGVRRSLRGFLFSWVPPFMGVVRAMFLPALQAKPEGYGRTSTAGTHLQN
ncbi:conserved hypothetical protein [Coccidioides posadasii str. Silveira]|uniref:Uncharacterized protein n=1 Tax=Coccidioides posadasii (strain RMSCC 757 / Silveira) TaxID=443226 RepID=E9D7X5_COCPS|nr:conserved hypothetical protein [Coccidioides posadasii str. Silveira]